MNRAPIQLPTPPKTPKTEKVSQFPFPDQPVLSKSSLGSKGASEIRISANLETSGVVQPKLEHPRRPPMEVRSVSNQRNISDTCIADPFNDEPAPQTPKHVLRPVSIASATPAELARIINRRYAPKPVGLCNIVAPKSSIGFNDTIIAGVSAGLGTSEAIQPKPEQPRQPPTEVRRLQNRRNDWDTSTADTFNDGLALPTSKTISRPISNASAALANGHSLKDFQALDLQRLIRREHGEKVCGTDISNDVGLLLAYNMG